MTPVKRWYLLGPMTAMNGVLLFGWSTAVIFEVLRMTLLVSGEEQLERSGDGPSSAPSATLLLARAQASSENLRIEKAPARVCRGFSLPERSVAGRYWRPVTAEAVVDAQGDQIHVLADPAVDESGVRRGLTTVNELLASPMNKWSYSTPNDQFGAKPYSNPTPTVPPQRVALAEASSTPVSVLEDAKAVARHRRAALYVQQRCVPGVADLAGKEADAIGLGARGEQRIDRG